MIVECVNWERALLRQSVSFVFNLLMLVWRTPSERCSVLLETVAQHYPNAFSQSEMETMRRILEALEPKRAMMIRRLTQYLDMTQFIMAFMDVVGILSNTNTKDALLVYEM